MNYIRGFALFSTVTFLLLCARTAEAQWMLQMGSVPATVGGISVKACDTNTAVVAGGAVYRTVDGGTNWTQIAPMVGAIDVSIIDSSHVWAATHSGRIYGTTDGGLHWTIQWFDSLRSNFIDYIRMFDLNNGIALGDNPVYGNTAVLIVKTTDGGAHWISMNDSAFGGASFSIWMEVSFASPLVGYFNPFGTSKGNVWKTTTGGATWIMTSYPGHGSTVPRPDVLKFYDENIGLIAPNSYACPHTIYRTLDGGVTWDSLPSPHRFWCVDFEFVPGDPSKVYMADSGHVYFSSDTGRTWSQQLSVEGKGWARDLAIVDSRHGWFVGDTYLYRTTNGGHPPPVAVTTALQDVPRTFLLDQNYPNPFNPSTTISYGLPRASRVRLRVYNTLGQEVATLVDESKAVGSYSVQFDGSGLSSGVYFYQMQTENFVQTRKLVLLR